MAFLCDWYSGVEAVSYLLNLHRDTVLSLATNARCVPAAELVPLQDAMVLVERLTGLVTSQEQRVTEAEQSARKAGELVGYEAGRVKALHNASHQLALTMEQLARDQSRQREELREALVALASGMVRCIAAELAPEQVLAALAVRAFEQVVPQQAVRLHLPPELVESVRAQLELRDLVLPVHCVADASLQGLDCRVESQAGSLLAGLDEMLSCTTQRLGLNRQTQACIAESA